MERVERQIRRRPLDLFGPVLMGRINLDHLMAASLQRLGDLGTGHQRHLALGG